ncbi:hypothetical protein, partial [Clostridium sp.]|uniref:hypothetical protein n=1 Tax=Clostridium sp. TaxID=1506 RepID=UPI002903BABE
DIYNYTTKAIVLRILEELDSPNFPKHIIIDEPILLKCHMGKLFLYARDAIDGAFNKSTICTAEKIALVDFIERYKNKKQSLRIADIGFEDYYLIHDLVCHKYGITNPEQYIVRESMKMAYFYSIYNHGNLELLHTQYSNSFKNFLMSFNNIFSTNYDKNIENAIEKNVFHIHGQFDKLSEVYNQDSFRNQMHDAPLEGISVDYQYKYLYSTAVSTYCGDYKQYQINQNILANEALEKMASAYLRNQEIRDDIDSWMNNSNQLVVNMADSIKLKISNPSLRFQEDYPINELKEISGTLIILGLSPYNDYHLFELIDNSNIEMCIYYFYSESEIDKVKEIFPKLDSMGKLKLQRAQEFWRDLR